MTEMAFMLARHGRRNRPVAQSCRHITGEVGCRGSAVGRRTERLITCIDGMQLVNYVFNTLETSRDEGAFRMDIKTVHIISPT